jgi:hypothetical protein
MNGEPGHRATDYGLRAVEAARRVIAELSEILRPFGDAMVLVGGWFPELSFPAAEPAHVGSLDVDLLLDPDHLPPAKGEELARILKAHDYRRTEPPFKLFKTVHIDDGEPVEVELDLLVPAGAPVWRTARSAMGLRPAPAVGGALALRSTHHVVLAPKPSRGSVQVEVVVPGVGAWLVMKAHALAHREKEKDAYDIAFCLRNLPQGPATVARELAPHRHQPEVRQALEILRTWFRSPSDFGPQAFSRFVDPADPDERAFLARDAYERVKALLRALELVDDGGRG